MKKKRFSNQRGLTLLETLAVTILIGLISLIIFNVVTSGQKSYNNQSNMNVNLRDITIALNSITRDFRQASSVIVDEDQNILTIGDVKYELAPSESILLKRSLSGEVLSRFYNVESFQISDSADDRNCIFLDIDGVNGKSVSTQICERN